MSSRFSVFVTFGIWTDGSKLHSIILEKMAIHANGDTEEPRLSHSHSLRFVGDWGGANFHRICSWLTQEFCDRAGPGSRTSILSLRDGGLDGLKQLCDGEADLVVSTPAALLSSLPDGTGPFATPMPHIRAIGTLPQNDRMVLAVDSKYNIKTFDELRKMRPALRIAASINDGTNPIGYVADKFLEAHGIPQSTIEEWGGAIVRAQRPEQCVALVETGQADALLQEAIMTVWWRRLVESGRLTPLPAELSALEALQKKVGLRNNPLPAGFWTNLEHDLPALDFSDFVLLVRDDMPEEVAHLLTWCLVETRHMLEGQYRHIPPAKSPLTYPLDPKKMAVTPVPLHPGAARYYADRQASGQQDRKTTTISPF